MKKRDHIIFIEGDEISMFLAESIFSAIDSMNTVQYFSDTEKAFDFIKGLRSSPESIITLFINASALIGETEIIKQIKASLHPFNSRLCLLTSLSDSEKREKELLQEIGIACYMEKPLTEEKLMQALERPIDSRMVE